MKTCIKYWGGKQQLVSRLLKLIPKHFAYCEPFFGGGALFFAKPPSKNEIINDINDNMVNFYRILKRSTTFEQLAEEIDLTLYSEWQYKQARELWKLGMDRDKVLRAWAVFVLSHQSFSGNLGSSWAHSSGKNQADYFQRVKKNFDHRYVRRLEHVQIFCRDALNVIENMDSPDTFFFLDPPYVDTSLGHYDGYTMENYIALLECLRSVQGKFLLTTFPTAVLEQYSEENSWKTIKNEMHLSASVTAGKKKTEVFTMNYAMDNEQLGLF